MATPSATEKTLYARLGSYDAIAALVDEFLETLSSDPQMARYSAGMNLERRSATVSSRLTKVPEKEGEELLAVISNLSDQIVEG
jgi:truncated hemoglobin YjbI